MDGGGLGCPGNVANEKEIRTRIHFSYELPGSWIRLASGFDVVDTIHAVVRGNFLKAFTLDFPRPWVWKTVLSALPVWVAFGLFSRMNHGAHLGVLTTVSVAAAGITLAAWALWREYGRAAKLRGAREAHSQFLAAAETSLDAFGLFESVRDDAGEIVDFRFLYVNANAERLAGLARSALLGQTLSAVTPIRATSSMFAKFCRVVDSGEPLNEEFPVKFDSVKATWLRSQVVKLGDGLAVTFSDISEAKATQERYAHLAEFTDSVFQNAPFSIVATDTTWNDYGDERGSGKVDGLQP